MKEERKHTRLPIVLDAEIHIQNIGKYLGQTKNISFGGIFITIDNQHNLNVGIECDIILLLEGSQKRLEIKIHGTIIHILNTGVGFKFLGIEIDHYEHFKNLLVHNCPEPSLLLEELQKDPGIKQK